METEKQQTITTDPVLSRLIQPYSKNNIQQLREQLCNEPGRKTIKTWHNKHLNDELIFDLCIEIGIPIDIKEYDFFDFNSAAVFICKNQLLRHDLTNEYQKYLIGKEYHYSSMLEIQSSQQKQNLKSKVASTIGKRLYLASGTVLKYGIYASAIDTIFESDPDFARQILSGHLLVSHDNIIELSRIPPDEIRSVAKNARECKIEHLTFADIRDGIKAKYQQNKAPVSRKERRELKLSESAQIRQMPVYDPDSDVNSLCMTIGSWISSIQRVNNSVDFNRITTKARLQLVKELSFLERTINTIQEALVERNNT